MPLEPVADALADELLEEELLPHPPSSTAPVSKASIWDRKVIGGNGSWW